MPSAEVAAQEVPQQIQLELTEELVPESQAVLGVWARVRGSGGGAWCARWRRRTSRSIGGQQ
jgi:hypothetical protein